MALDKVQILRNIMKKLNRSGFEMPYTVEAVDSLDEQQLIDYFKENITTTIVVPVEDSAKFKYRVNAEATEPFVTGDWSSYDENTFAQFLDGAFFFKKGEFKEGVQSKGVRVNDVNGKLVLSSVDDAEKSLHELYDAVDYKEELEFEQDRFEKAQEFINKTPKPKAPGFFARLFNTKANKEYNAYLAQAKILDESEKKMKDLADKLAKSAPTLKDPESIYKEREFDHVPEAQVQPVVQEIQQPEVQKPAAKKSGITPELKNYSSVNFESVKDMPVINGPIIPPVQPAVKKPIAKKSPMSFFEKAPEGFKAKVQKRPMMAFTLNDNQKTEIELEQDTYNPFEKKPVENFNEEIELEQSTYNPFEKKPAEPGNQNIEIEASDYNPFEKKNEDFDFDGPDNELTSLDNPAPEDDWGAQLIEGNRKMREEEAREAERLRAEAEKQRALEEKLKAFRDTQDKFMKNYRALEDKMKKNESSMYATHPAYKVFKDLAEKCIVPIRSYYQKIDMGRRPQPYQQSKEDYARMIAAAKVLSEVRADVIALGADSGIVPEDSFAGKSLDKAFCEERIKAYCEDPAIKALAAKMPDDIGLISDFTLYPGPILKSLDIKPLDKQAEGPSMGM